MEFKLYKISGYEEAINSLRMSTGKFYSWEKAQEIQDLVYAVTNKQGFLANHAEQFANRLSLGLIDGWGNEVKKHPKISHVHNENVAEFERLLTLTFNNAMKDHKHHTLMKYIDVSFFTEGLHRGAQDDLDAHAIAFNNRITRYSTRLAEIDDVKLSEWYRDKIIPFNEAVYYMGHPSIPGAGVNYPKKIYVKDETFSLTPFGYVLEKYAQVPAKNGLAKDVQRGLMPLGLESSGIWKTDIFNLRYVYSMRSKLTKANPELKLGMEQLADQIEEKLPVFGPYFRKVYTDSKQWEHVNKVKTISSEEYQEYQKFKRESK